MVDDSPVTSLEKLFYKSVDRPTHGIGLILMLNCPFFFRSKTDRVVVPENGH